MMSSCIAFAALCRERGSGERALVELYALSCPSLSHDESIYSSGTFCTPDLLTPAAPEPDEAMTVALFLFSSL